MFDFKASAFGRPPRSRSIPRNVITTLHRSGLALVEELACPAPSSDRSSVGVTDRFHIVLPLSGSFNYFEGSRTFYAGVNHVLLMPPRREYRTAHPVEGDRSLVVFPRGPIADLFAAFRGIDARDTEVRSVSPELRLAALGLYSSAQRGADPLTLDELSIDLCRAVFSADRIDAPARTTGRGATLARAKEYLHANFRDSITLADVASAAGVSPVYLTQLFKRSLGLALHQYVIGLRLHEALFALGEARDLTALALDLGFSSHSHFTAVFRSRFGLTPSIVRQRYVPEVSSTATVPVVFPERPLCAARGGAAEPVR